MWRELRPTLTLALPIIIGQISQMAMNLTDSAMIGRVGTVPLAGAAFAGNLFGLFYILGIGLLLPVAVLVARARGAKKPEECGQLLRHGLVLATLFGGAEVVVMAVLGTQLERFGQAPEVVAVAGPFYFIIALSLLPVLLFQALRQFAESMGRPWVPMMIMTAGVLLNAGLNWLLIYGHGGFPALGLTGAGYSTLISRTLGAVVLAFWLRQDRAIRPAWPARWRETLSRSRFEAMLRLGLPASGQLLFESCAFTAASIMIGWLGAVSLAAHQIAISCAAMTFMFTLGLATAASMRIGQAAGAHEPERLRPIGFGALAAGLGFMSVFAIGFAFGGNWLAAQFVNDTAVIGLAGKLLVVAAFFQLFDGAQVIGAGILRGLTDVRVPTAITCVAYWLIALPGGYWFGVHRGNGAVGVWIALAAGLAFAGIFLAARFAFLTRRRV